MFLVWGGTLQACASATFTEPGLVAHEFADAVARKDAQAVYSMLDEQTRRNVTVEQVAILLARDGDELTRRTKRLADAPAVVEARVGLEGGQTVELKQREAAFYVDTPALNGAAALTPMEAVVALRGALEAGSYSALLQVLTPELREQVEQHRKRLIEALRYEEALELTQEGERLLINTADGHRVVLERKLGVWRVHDFN